MTDPQLIAPAAGGLHTAHCARLARHQGFTSLATGRVDHTAWCRPSPRPRELPINHLGGSADHVVLELAVGELRLERAPQVLAGDLEVVARPARLELDDPHLGIVHAVAAGVCLLLGEGSEPLPAHRDDPNPWARGGRARNT